MTAADNISEASPLRQPLEPFKPERSDDPSIGRIVSVTGAKAIVLLDRVVDGGKRCAIHRPEMGTLLAIDTPKSVALAIVSALSVPVPAQREGDAELWIAELGLVGELQKDERGRPVSFNRGVNAYPSLGDRVRVSTKAELEIAFCGDVRHAVRVGCIRQDNSIPAMIRVDDMLGKHFAILGTTGTGKSCTTALILRSILKSNPAAHIVLLDPHNEYATAFPEWAEVVNPRNMQLPYWLLTFEELVEVVIGSTNSSDKKAEVEVLQELIPIAKSRYGSARQSQSMRPRALDAGRFTVDTPVPYRMSDLTALIDERMGKLENKRDLSPYRNLKTRIDTLSLDPRYTFMFGSLTVYDSLSQILGRLFRVPVNDKPITILELTGLPTEIINVVVSVVCRMTFDFALFSEGRVPVTLVCEEAHRYVPVNSTLGFEPCKRSIAKIAKEGRKYGASLCIITQRPAEIDPTIISQCNTVFALRMSNDRDQEIVRSAISDTGSGLLEFLSALAQREAIAFGDGVALPVRIRFDDLPKECMPRSSTARFTEMWQKSTEDADFLEHVVERWRNSSSGGENHNQIAAFADALGLGEGEAQAHAHTPVASAAQSGGFGQPDGRPAGRLGEPRQPSGAFTQRQLQPGAPANGGAPAGGAGLRRREPMLTTRKDPAPASPPPPANPAAAAGPTGFRALRERLATR